VSTAWTEILVSGFGEVLFAVELSSTGAVKALEVVIAALVIRDSDVSTTSRESTTRATHHRPALGAVTPRTAD
jgi:hypothetical protein